jgi:hypothetical protein
MVEPPLGSGKLQSRLNLVGIAQNQVALNA